MPKDQKFPGGLLVGETDKNGGPGIKVIAPEGDILMGGGELVLTSDTGKSDTIHEFDGKKMTPCQIASELNQDGGGVKIPCHIAEPANTTDSKMKVGDVIKNGAMATGGEIDWDFGRIKEDARVRTTPTHFGKWEYRYGTVLKYLGRDTIHRDLSGKETLGLETNIWRVKWDDGEESDVPESLIERTKEYGGSMAAGGEAGSKKIIRRNLPINKEYKLIDSFYTGGILENPMSCDNCNKPIANVAVIQDEDGKKFHVGMDCAETLSSIKNSMQFNQASHDFSEATAIRAKVRNAMRKNPNAKLAVENNYLGTISMSVSGAFSGTYPKEFFMKHLPDLAKHISNPEKNQFVPRFHDNYDFNFDFEYFKKEAIDGKLKLPNYNGPRTINLDAYKAVVSYGPIPFTKSDGTVGHNDSYNVKTYKGDTLIGERIFYMHRDIPKNIIYTVNEHEFNNFNITPMAATGTRIPFESNEDKLDRLRKDLLALEVKGEGKSQQARVIKSKILALKKQTGSSMETGGDVGNSEQLWNKLSYRQKLEFLKGHVEELNNPQDLIYNFSGRSFLGLPKYAQEVVSKYIKPSMATGGGIKKWEIENSYVKTTSQNQQDEIAKKLTELGFKGDHYQKNSFDTHPFIKIGKLIFGNYQDNPEWDGSGAGFITKYVESQPMDVLSVKSMAKGGIDSYMGHEGDRVVIEKTGAGDRALYHLINAENFSKVDMFFDSKEEAKKYADKAKLIVVENFSGKEMATGGEVAIDLTPKEVEDFNKIFGKYAAKDYFGTNALIENKELQRKYLAEKGDELALSMTKSDIERMYREMDYKAGLKYFKRIKKLIRDNDKVELKKTLRASQKMTIEYVEALTGKSLNGLTNQKALDGFVDSLIPGMERGGEVGNDYSGTYQDLREFVIKNKLQQEFSDKYKVNKKDWEDFVGGEMGTDEEVIEELMGKGYKIFYDEDEDEFIITQKKTDKLDYKIVLSNKKYDKKVIDTIESSGIHTEYDPRFAVLLGDKVIGGSTYKIDEDNVYNFDLAVNEKYQGYGISKELIEKIIADAKNLKADEVKAYVVNNMLFQFFKMARWNIEVSSGEKYTWKTIRPSKKEEGGSMATGGAVKTEDIDDMLWVLRKDGPTKFYSAANVTIADELVERGLAEKTGSNEYAITKKGEMQLMEKGGRTPNMNK